MIVRTDAASKGVDVWTGNGQMPTKDIFYATAVKVADGISLVSIPAGGNAYVAFGNNTPATFNVEVEAETGAFLLFDTGMIIAPNAGTASLTLFGNGFEEGMEVWIEKGGVRSRATDLLAKLCGEQFALGELFFHLFYIYFS